MTDTMNKAWRTLLMRESGGQLFLFDDEKRTNTGGPFIEAKIWDETAKSIELVALLIRLIDKHGIEHSISDYCTAIRKHEGKMFQVQRDPDTTLTGRKARHLDYDRAKIFVKRLP